MKYEDLKISDKDDLLEAKDMGIEWVVRDCTNELWGYYQRPHRFKTYNGGFLWCLNIDNIDLGAEPLDAETLLFVKCEANPVKIDDALGEIAKMEKKK